MELRHLRYFLVLSEELHFGRAAARLSITQPPLSFNIKQLEDDLGVKLFDRDNKRVELTAAGRAFLPEAQAVLAQATRARDAARAVGQGLAGRLEVGFSGSMIYVNLRGIVEQFNQWLPNVELSLREYSAPDQIEGLRHGRLDAAFVDTVSIPEGLCGEMIREEPYVACVPATHRLAEATSIALRELADDDFVTFRREGAPGIYDRIVSVCLAAGFQPRVRHAVRQWLTIVALVAEGTGAALVPQRMSQARFPGVRFIPLADTTLTSTGHFIWNPEREVAGLDTLLRAVQASRAVAVTPQFDLSPK